MSKSGVSFLWAGDQKKEAHPVLGLDDLIRLLPSCLLESGLREDSLFSLAGTVEATVFKISEHHGMFQPDSPCDFNLCVREGYRREGTVRERRRVQEGEEREGEGGYRREGKRTTRKVQ